MLKENIEIVKKNIARACKKAGRSQDEVTLIAVSKTKPCSLLQESYDCGNREFGENKVQELVEKCGVLPKDIRWHMIGHLQRNKVKQIVDKVTLIHSVDSLRLAKTIEQEAAKKEVIVPILLEVNVAEEESKYGFKVEEVFPAATQIATFPHVQIKGLMTIAPFVDDPEENRPVFASLRNLSLDLAKKNLPNVSMHILSMGMTNDYEVAIEEGATMVRVGTGIFGERKYNL